jgi:hypothetical protein
MSADDVKNLMALPPAQRIVAERTGIVPDKPAFPGALPNVQSKNQENKPSFPGSGNNTEKPGTDTATE